MKTQVTIQFIIDCGDTEATGFQAQKIFTKMLNEFLNNSFDVDIVDTDTSVSGKHILILNSKKDVQPNSEGVK
jgi:N-acetylglutamate synthase/N-acetylornithine aminotransferase